MSVAIITKKMAVCNNVKMEKKYDIHFGTQHNQTDHPYFKPKAQ